MARHILRHVPPAVRARDAGVRRLRRLTMGAAVFGTAGTVVLGGAAAVNDPGRAAPTNAPAAQTGPSATNSAPTAPPVTDGASRHHRASTPVAPGLVPPVVTRGQPGSGLVTSGGS